MKKELKSLFEKLKQGRAVGDQGRHEEARVLFEEVRKEAAARGIRSADLSWFLSVCHDYLGDPATAMRFVQEAIELDPLALPAWKSFEIIAENLREKLAAQPPGAAETPRLYQILVDCGVADAGSHLAMAKHHAHAGQPAEALALLEAVTRLEPACMEAWEALLPLAIREGRADLSEAAELALASARLGRAAVVSPSHVASA